MCCKVILSLLLSLQCSYPLGVVWNWDSIVFSPTMERSIGEIWKARWESAYEPSCLRLPRGLELLICHLLLRGPQKGVSVTIPKLLGQWLSVAGSDTERRQPGAGVRNKAA